jgi:hypothetical protein
MEKTRVKTKYMEFCKDDSYTGKTEVWVIRNSNSGGRLGTIKWYGAWRQYCFFPEADCVFNNGCLKDIIEFINDCMTVKNKIECFPH